MGRVACLLVAVALAGGVAGCAHRAPEQVESSRAVGTPVPPSSPLARIQVGMSEREVLNILGSPTDENAYVTGKAFIPWYFGRDRWRKAYFYKGLGRIAFAGGGGFSGSAHVQRVEYDPNEPGRAR